MTDQNHSNDQNGPNDQSLSRGQPVNLDSQNGDSSTIPKKTPPNTFKQTFGKCQRCGKNQRKTMHMQCRHITCCFTCAEDCKECPYPRCGLPLIKERNKHLAVYACYYESLNTPGNINEGEEPECMALFSYSPCFYH
ncbi:unnamed protein product [Rotaria magnacalcarata]|uniref:Uncharacterized protein n=2 Tax=Rotaria magnacalcarata TaxID=392030 RepID=A0A816ZUR5_9BILA|nr:unnamed protein product [Rotaria magnacalcarata]CAF5182343.1 unnamed protein product [Rotaria magnacalcarata]